MYMICPESPIIHTQFPNIEKLKHKIAQSRKKQSGWPTCIIKASASQVFRPNIDGPLSLFTNISGISQCNVGNGNVAINSDNFFISNSEQIYTLEIDSSLPTQTLNIHFGDELAQSAMQTLTKSSGFVLEHYKSYSTPLPVFFNSLYAINTEIRNLLSIIYKTDDNDIFKIEEILILILEKILRSHSTTIKEAERLPHIKHANKVEIYKRLLIGRDYIYSNTNRNISLQEIAKVSMMSRFHFLRAFKTAFGKTPYQMLISKRIDKAKELLQSTDFPITDICYLIGFESVPSFTLLFKKIIGCPPHTFRLSKKSNFQ